MRMPVGAASGVKLYAIRVDRQARLIQRETARPDGSAEPLRIDGDRRGAGKAKDVHESVIVRVGLPGADRDLQGVGLRWDRTVVVIRERAGRIVSRVEVEQVVAARQLLHIDIPAQRVGLDPRGRIPEKYLNVAFADTRLE